jgi:hypothetical protein
MHQRYHFYQAFPAMVAFNKKFNMQDIPVGPAPNDFLQDLLKLCRTGIYKILKFKLNRKGCIQVKETIQASHQQWNIKKITIFFRSGESSWFTRPDGL